MNSSLNLGKRTGKSPVSWDAGNDISETDYGWSRVRKGSDSNTGRGRCLEPLPTQCKPIPPRNPRRLHLLLSRISICSCLFVGAVSNLTKQGK